MRRLGVLIAIVVHIHSAAAQNIPVKGSTATFDLATWNIEHFGNDGAEPHDDERQLENVRQVIVQSQIDLWAVQEIEDDEDFERFVSALGGGWRGELDRASTNLKIGFIYNSDVIHLRRKRNILTTYTSKFAGRPPLVIEVDVAAGDRSHILTIVTLHMKCCTDSWERREGASKALKDYLDFLLPSASVIVLGDWNDELTTSITSGRSTPYRNFLDDSEDYSFVTLDLEQAGRNTFCFSSSCSSGSTIDHILITNELFAAFDTTDTFDELITALSPYVSSTSDHLPVFARFSLPTDTAIEDMPEAVLSIQSIHPNPLSSSAVLEFSTGRAGHVLVEIYDLLGRRTAVLSYGFLPAGPHVEQVNTNGLAAGPYVLVVRTQDARLVRPISVIR